jgi:hypothetical protein
VIMKKWESLQGNGFPLGRTLATILVMSIHDVIWPIYKLSRRAMASHDVGTVALQIAPILYFGFWTFVFLLFLREGKSYRWMIFDSLCISTIISVAVVLDNPLLHSTLDQLGYSRGVWLVVLPVVAIATRLAQAGETGRGETGDGETGDIHDK